MGGKKGSTNPGEAFGLQVWGCSRLLGEQGFQFMPPNGFPMTGARLNEKRFELMLIH
jgi:hypothetical protein